MMKGIMTLAGLSLNAYCDYVIIDSIKKLARGKKHRNYQYRKGYRDGYKKGCEKEVDVVRVELV